MARVIVSTEHDPYQNLALEEELLFTPHDGLCLYLWQNQNTVVIGRNQNPYLECDISYMNQKGIRLARRLSGGGAVYHDLGNLNYTFLGKEKDLDPKRQTQLLARVLHSFGISCTFSGRNDLLCEGRKCSGQAYYSEDGFAYHHGTLLINSDLTAMEKILTPSRLKLEAKGISSVRSRVVNLNELSTSITAEQIARRLIQYFEEEYGNKKDNSNGNLFKNLTIWDFKAKPPQKAAEYSSSAWILGKCPDYEATMDIKTETGIFRLQAKVEEGLIQEAILSTDSLNPLTIQNLEKGLTGCLFEETAIRERLIEYSIAPTQGRLQQ